MILAVVFCKDIGMRLFSIYWILLNNISKTKITLKMLLGVYCTLLIVDIWIKIPSRRVKPGFMKVFLTLCFPPSIQISSIVLILK